MIIFCHFNFIWGTLYIGHLLSSSMSSFSSVSKERQFIFILSIVSFLCQWIPYFHFSLPYYLFHVYIFLLILLFLVVWGRFYFTFFLSCPSLHFISCFCFMISYLLLKFSFKDIFQRYNFSSYSSSSSLLLLFTEDHFHFL